MTRICPKCNHIRQPSDDCPEWQCPACQVAYNKAAAPAPADYGRYAARSVTADAAKPSLYKWLLLAVVVAVLAWAAKPVWQKSRANTAVEVAADQPPVTLYSTAWCGYCTATREWLVANDIQYVELDIEKTTAGYEGHKKLGGKGVPLIVIGDDLMNGYNEAWMQHMLRPWVKGS